MANNPLRRRAKLEPLNGIEDERGLQNEDPFSTLFISPCQIKVSNDPFEDIPYEDIIPCNLTEYECPNDKAVTSRTELLINYDFELHFVAGADRDVTLDALEGAQLQHAAALAGLLDCGATAIDRGNNRALQASLLTDDEKKALLSISSAPADMFDPQYTECIVPVQSAVSVGTTCVPIKGSITATIDSTASSSVEDGILRGMMRVARVGMTEDIYVSGNIRKVSFIGTRADSENAFATDSSRGFDEGEDDDGAGLSGIGIAFICIGGILMLSLIALFAAKQRRRRHMERDMIFTDATVEAKEIQAAQAAMHDQDALDRQAAEEGADIPGSLAHADELALQPSNSSFSIKTGDLDDDKGLVDTPYMPPYVEEVPDVPYMPPYVEEVPDVPYMPSYVEEVPDVPYMPPYVPEEEAASIDTGVDFLSDTGTSARSFDMTSISTDNQSIDTNEYIDAVPYESDDAEDVDLLNVVAESDDDDDLITAADDDDSVHELQRIV